MKEIVKICVKHGERTKDQVTVEKNGSKKGFFLRCNQCKLEKDRRWKDSHREQHRASAGKAKKEARLLFRAGLSTEEPKANVWSREYRKQEPELHKQWAKKIRDKYGEFRSAQEISRTRNITVEQYLQMFEEQNFLCAICNQPETRKSRTAGQLCRLAIDHNHTTGIVRELLCHACNQVIGHSRENIEILTKAVKYLQKHNT